VKRQIFVHRYCKSSVFQTNRGAEDVQVSADHESAAKTLLGDSLHPELFATDLRVEFLLRKERAFFCVDLDPECTSVHVWISQATSVREIFGNSRPASAGLFKNGINGIVRNEGFDHTAVLMVIERATWSTRGALHVVDGRQHNHLPTHFASGFRHTETSRGVFLAVGPTVFVAS
jgi:hypothetical protein